MEIIDFKFSKAEYQKLIYKIKNNIKENKEFIEQAKAIDSKHSKININTSKLTETLDLYVDSDIKNDEKIKTYIVDFNGDINLSVQICMYAILNKIHILLNVNSFMFALNKVLVDIINFELKNYGINNLITVYENIDYDNFEELKNIQKIVVIDDMDIYKDLKEFLNFKNIELIKYASIDIYCDDDELVELRDMICDYARFNHIQAEIFDDYEKSRVADIIYKYGDGGNVVLLSNDKNLQETFKNAITDRNLYINRIPLNEVRKLEWEVQ